LVIIRVQYGSNMIDPRYKEYVAGCKKYNIPFAHYAYARFVSVNDAKFLVVDVEEQTTKTEAEMLPATQAFINYLKANTSKKIGLYTGNHFYKPYSMDKVKVDFLWVPRYERDSDGSLHTIKPDMSCDLWQYTDKGKITGISGDMDIN